MPELPALGHGPFRPWVASTWYKLLNRAEQIMDRCIEEERSWVKWRKGPYAGVSWFIGMSYSAFFMLHNPCFMFQGQKQEHGEKARD